MFNFCCPDPGMKKREKLSPNNSSNNLCPPPRTGIINIPSMTDKEAKRKESKGDKPKAELLSKKDSKLDSLNRRETLGRNEHFQRSGGTMSRVRKSLSFAKDRRSSVSMALIGSTVGGKVRILSWATVGGKVRILSWATVGGKVRILSWATVGGKVRILTWATVGGKARILSWATVAVEV